MHKDKKKTQGNQSTKPVVSFYWYSISVAAFVAYFRHTPPVAFSPTLPWYTLVYWWHIFDRFPGAWSSRRLQVVSCTKIMGPLSASLFSFFFFSFERAYDSGRKPPAGPSAFGLYHMRCIPGTSYRTCSSPDPSCFRRVLGFGRWTRIPETIHASDRSNRSRTRSSRS